jgi:hypothetical protein
MLKYQLKKDFYAANVNYGKIEGAPKNKNYYKDDYVSGEIFHYEKKENEPYVPSVIVDGSFVIPLIFLEQISDKADMKKMPDEVKSKIQEVSSGKMTDNLQAAGAGFTTGATIGLVFGLLAAYKFKKAYWKLGLLGFSLGGYAGYKVTEAQTKPIAKPKYY